MSSTSRRFTIAERILHDIIAELLDDLIMHIRLKERGAHPLHRLPNVFLGNATTPRQPAKDIRKPI
jgi:hypothetical protein